MSQHDDERSDEDLLGNSEDPDESDVDDSPAEVACPSCQQMISEEAERCPHCGSYVVAGAAPRRFPWWVVVGVVLLIAAILAYVLR